MGMSPRTLRPQLATHPEALAWRTAAVANGGSVTGRTLSAVDKFCKAIDLAGIRDRFYRLNLFCGNGLNACLVPLYRGPSRTGTQYGNTTDTNKGPFVSGDYAESTGLLGNGTSKYLNTGFNVDNLTASSFHLSSYICGTQNITSARTLLGTLFNGVTDRYRIFLATTGSTAPKFTVAAELGKANQVSVANNESLSGLILSSRTSTSSLTLYDDGVSIASSTTETAETVGAVPIFVFARNGPTEYYNGLMAAYSIGSGLTASQAASFSSAMQAFQTALNRNA